MSDNKLSKIVIKNDDSDKGTSIDLVGSGGGGVIELTSSASEYKKDGIYTYQGQYRVALRDGSNGLADWDDETKFRTIPGMNIDYDSSAGRLTFTKG